MLTVSTLFKDPTPSGFINQRVIFGLARLAEDTDLTDAEKKQLMTLLVLIGHKLASVYLHSKDYAVEEDKLIAAGKKDPITKSTKVVRLEPSQTLFFEFDEFLVQVKSTLDHAVKAPLIALGRGKWNLRTFGGKGNDVINALKNNVPRDKKLIAKALTQTVIDNQQWLQSTIDARDKINHFVDGGINFEYFTVSVLSEGGSETVRVPMWSPDMTVRAFMETIWGNLIGLTESFVGGCFGFRLKKGLVLFHGPSDMTSVKSPWKVTTEEVMHKVVAKPGWKSME